MASYSLFKSKFKKTIADAIYHEVTSKTARYYHWFGKENSWEDFLSPFIPSNQTVDEPLAPSDNYRYDLYARRDILTAKAIKPSDVSYVVRRINWVSGTTYDDYDDAYDIAGSYAGGPAHSGATKLEEANFYVLTTQNNVYKCIWNNKNNPSTIMPTGTTPDVFETSDGYKWKFMYTIPISLQNKFLSSEYMPVSNALKAQFYNSGEISNITIEDGGANYSSGVNQTTVAITGDGYLKDNPYTIDKIEILDAGEGYTSIPQIVISDPVINAVQYSPNLNVVYGSYVYHINGNIKNFYYVVSGTQLGSTGPVHQNGTITNGSAQLEYVGTTAQASCAIINGSLTTSAAPPSTDQIVALSTGNKTNGYGYNNTITAQIDPPFVKDLDWEENATVTLNDIVYHNYYFYEVTNITNNNNVFNSTEPTHTSGVATYGDIELTQVGKQAQLKVITEKTEASIDLKVSPGIDSVYSVIVSNTIQKYTENPTITIDPPVSGTTATATANSLNGKVNNVVMTNPGNGYTAAPPVAVSAPAKTFNAYLDVSNNTINYSAGTLSLYDHLLLTGDEVVYDNGGGTDIVGLTNGTTYYIIRVTDTSFKLASSLSNAESNTAITITPGNNENHTLTMSTGATAISTLGTGGEIVDFIINDGGVGYTNANFEVVDTVGSGSGAILVANFDTGTVDTLQSNVELLAIPGAIYTIKMVEGGTGYSTAVITIVGDGEGATATATINNGQITHIEITNPGRNYTWTDVQITGNAGSSGAVARAIMSPAGGHGSNAIDELNANAIVFYTSISRDKNQGIEINNDYRKVGLVRNFKQFGSNRKFTDDVGSGCILVTGVFDKTKLTHDMLLSIDSYKKYRIVDFNDTQILLSVFNNFPISVGDILVSDPTNGGKVTNPGLPVSNITVDAVSERTIDQFSGDFLFLSVREPYSPTSDQIITVRTIVEI